MQDKKAILITGCSSGIGFVTAIKFASKGYTVYAGVRNEKSDGAQRLLHLAEEQSLDVQLLRLDITSEKNVLEVISLIEKKKEKLMYWLTMLDLVHLDLWKHLVLKKLKSNTRQMFLAP